MEPWRQWVMAEAGNYEIPTGLALGSERCDLSWDPRLLTTMPYFSREQRRSPMLSEPEIEAVLRYQERMEKFIATELKGLREAAASSQREIAELRQAIIALGELIA
jgi:hypothetical protein